MKMALDCSPGQIHKIRRENLDLAPQIMQLRTPLTRYRADNLGVFKYGLDNGAFSRPPGDIFLKMALAAKDDPACSWIVMPDVVGDAGSTTVLFHYWVQELNLEDKRAYALQDGVQNVAIPWNDFECLFIGGTDYFKESSGCLEIAARAKELGKWIHVGRVNTPRRIVYWDGIGDSFDGSGISRFTDQRNQAFQVMRELTGTHQERFFL
ncbi:MAG TPA: hypothetical protein EYN66_06410 [Myxococcales bacterium]|nr:hypothetical protein [Myxococcales bacterium]